MYPEITKFLSFYIDSQAFLTNNKCFILIGEHISFLTAFFNSSLFKYCFKDNFPELLGGTRELRKVFLDKIPVIKISDKINKEFEELVFKLQDAAKKQQATKDLEITIDERLFKLYGLTNEEKEEIGFIEIR